MLQLELLPYFMAVVDAGSLNQASKSLNLSQPALSRKIAKLEEMLGVTLFERAGKRLKITEVGKLTYSYAQELSRLEKQFLQSITTYQPHIHKELYVGASLTTLPSTLPDLIRYFTEDSARYDLKALTGKTHEVIHMVKEQQVDFGIVASRIQEDELVCIPLFEDHLALVLPKKHALGRELSVSIQTLHDLSMILFAKGSWYRVLTDELLLKHQVRPLIKMEIDSFEAIIRLIALNGYASLLPQSYLRPATLKDNGLVQVEVAELKEMTRTTSLIYRKDTVFHPEVESRLQSAVRFFHLMKQDAPGQPLMHSLIDPN
ncbi:LysR family transcriptional regulator [Marinicrinis sediminis]|uniref:LysR family transcriptional regulator n=1 Tax=Marinicrinis sediminis TaxID=1652465 RepID=A0ABW5R7A1_9BACL